MGTLLVAAGFAFLLSSSQSPVETWFTGFPTAGACEEARLSKIEKYRDWPAVSVSPACIEIKPSLKASSPYASR